MDEYLTTNEAGKKVHLTPHCIAYQAHHKQIDAYKTSERKWLVKVRLNDDRYKLVKVEVVAESEQAQVAAEPPSKETDEDTRLKEHFDQLAAIAKELASRVQELLYHKSKGNIYQGNIIDGLYFYGVPFMADLGELRKSKVKSHLARAVFVHYEHKFGKSPCGFWEDVTMENVTQELADNLLRLANSRAFEPCPRCPVCVELAGIEPVSPDSIPAVDGKTGEVWYMRPMPPDF